MTAQRSSSVRRVLVATDRSDTAERAVEWAREMAERYGAELILVQVLLPANGFADPSADPRVHAAREELAGIAHRLAGTRGRCRVVVDEDPSRAIVDAAENEEADVVVVGNVAMRGRKEFLLANVPNRVSHNSPCTVVIVNTEEPERRGLSRLLGRR